MIIAGAGHDRVDAGYGRDTVYLGPGNDTALTRDRMADVIYGGPGNDVVVKDPGTSCSPSSESATPSSFKEAWRNIGGAATDRRSAKPSSGSLARDAERRLGELEHPDRAQQRVDERREHEQEDAGEDRTPASRRSRVSASGARTRLPVWSAVLPILSGASAGKRAWIQPASSRRADRKHEHEHFVRHLTFSLERRK